ALNAACWAAHQGQPLPVLFVCEDNGLGISVPTPRDWVEESCRARPGLRYFAGDGLDVIAAYSAARAAASWVRTERRPAFLHLGVVRLLGHAGSDIETGYRSLEEIEASEALDPLRVTAEALVEAGAATPEEILAMYDASRARVDALAEEAVRRPKLT